MKNEIIIKGRSIYPGVSEGEALVSPIAMMGWGNFSVEQGYTVERGHPLYEKPITGKILVLPYVRGSGGFIMYGHTRFAGTNPIGLLISQSMSISVMTAMILKYPTMTDFDRDPVKIIETGDWLIVNADEGYVKICKGGKGN